MTDRVSSVDTDAITARLAKVQHPPWRMHYPGIIGDAAGWTVATCGHHHDNSYLEPSASDHGDFVAHAPGDIAALLAEVARLRHAVERCGASQGEREAMSEITKETV